MFECELWPDTGYLFQRPLEGLGAKDGHGRPFKFKLPTTSKESAWHRQIQKTRPLSLGVPRYHMIPTDKYLRWHCCVDISLRNFWFQVDSLFRHVDIGTLVLLLRFFPLLFPWFEMVQVWTPTGKCVSFSGLKLKKWTAAIWPRLGFICWKMVVFKVWCPATPPPSHAPRYLSKILLEALPSAWISRCQWADFHMEGRWSSSNPGVWTIWKLQKR